MGATQRKMMKKTRLERLDVHIQRLTLFNQNAMHEVGKLATALRYYADPKVWEGRSVPGITPDAKKENVVLWVGLEDGPIVARKVLNSLGLPWDKFPVKDGEPTDPEQPGQKSVLHSAAQEVKAEKAGLEEDDRSHVTLSLGEDDRSEYGRYEGAEEADKKAGVESPHLPDDSIPPEER